MLDVVDDAWILSAVETEISSNTLIGRFQANERISLKRYVKFLRMYLMSSGLQNHMHT